MFPLFDHRKFVFYLSLGIAAVLISSQITSTFNPYGIILSYLGAVIFVAAFSHKWVKAGSYHDPDGCFNRGDHGEYVLK